MAEEKESTSIPLSQAENSGVDPEDPAKSPPRPSSPNSSTRKACCFVLQSWVSKKFMTGCVVLFPVAVTFFITWWFIQFVDGFFSPLYERLGIDIFGLGFITSLLFVFFVGVFVSSWMGAAVFSVGEWVIKRMPFVRHLYSASKQISAAISPDQNTTAFKEVAIIRHPRVGEYAFGFITSSVVLQSSWNRTGLVGWTGWIENQPVYWGSAEPTSWREAMNPKISWVECAQTVFVDWGLRENEDEELCSVFVPTNHLYIGDIFLVNSKEIIRPNLSIREGIEIIVSGGMTMPQVISPQERFARQKERIPLNRMM
ncbi:Methanol dehydrogenase [cytochrome c] subunit 1 [Gossypium arboreum]|uniref:Methanol dehydrogenase [cytochrome c] subunit 1 n=2 Tax=Gossypium TaxID=3633 RepID=A0A0B0NYT6_GOSAR|nr:Methanol dehydrogenase [cytochrome c] subunit 1 [Gossypium arboreum]